MSASLRSFRAFIHTFSDIGTAVRASREFTRLSVEAPTARSQQRPISNLLPH